MVKGFGDGAGGAKDAETSPLSELIARFNERFGTEFTEADVIKPFNEAVADPKVRAAAVANDEENFGNVFEPVFEEKMMDHIETAAELGRQYFGPRSEVRSTLNRSARRAAWRMIREQAGVTDDVA